MPANPVNPIIPLASLLGAIGWVAACASSHDDSDGPGAAAGASGTEVSAGASAGGAAASGGQSASGGTIGAGCGQPGPYTSVLWRADEGAGGKGGAAANAGVGDILCFPGAVCFTRPVPTPGLSFAKEAFAALAVSGAFEPLPRSPNPSGLPTAKVSYPKPGTVCMSGDDGAILDLNFGGSVEFVARTGVAGRPENFHASELGITAVSFKIQTPPSTGLGIAFLSADPCWEPLFSDAQRGGNTVLITTSGETTTLTFATNFTPAFDANAIGSLLVAPGAGAYDFCVTDLAFLDANGDEVKP